MSEGDAGIEALHRADLEHQPGIAHGGGKRFTLFDRNAKRFFDQHMLAGGKRLLRHCDVELVGDGDDDGVDIRIGEHGAEIGIGCLRLVKQRHFLDEIFGEITDRVELGVLRFPAGIEMGRLRDLPASEHADPEFARLAHG